MRSAGAALISDKATSGGTEKVTDVTEKVTDVTEKKIIELLKNNSKYKTAELAETLNVTVMVFPEIYIREE